MTIGEFTALVRGPKIQTKTEKPCKVCSGRLSTHRKQPKVHFALCRRSICSQCERVSLIGNDETPSDAGCDSDCHSEQVSSVDKNLSKNRSMEYFSVTPFFQFRRFFCFRSIIYIFFTSTSSDEANNRTKKKCVKEKKKKEKKLNRSIVALHFQSIGARDYRSSTSFSCSVYCPCLVIHI